VEDALLGEVEQLAGPRYDRGDAHPAVVRWGAQRGSVYLADQKLAIAVPRVRDRAAAREVPLVLDGKSFAGDELVLALGVTAIGEKYLLGLVQTARDRCVSQASAASRSSSGSWSCWMGPRDSARLCARCWATSPSSGASGTSEKTW
jgi:hypothetical protein